MSAKFIFYFISFIISTAEVNIAQTKAFIGTPGTESDSAFSILHQLYPSSEKITLSDIDNKKFNVVWIHHTDTSDIHLDEKEIDKLKEYIFKGGNLLLTLEAFQLVYKLGLEKNKPELKYIPAIDDGYGRKLGFHSLINHPVFNGLHGGAYVWNSYEDNVTRMWGYFDDNIPSGKTAAVDWSYITLNENSKIIIEYDYGEGKILAVGAYTFYSPENFNKENLRIFTKNCLDYLAGKLNDQEKYYWNYQEPEINCIPSSEISPSEMDAFPWEEKNTLNIKSLYASENYWDLAGERILIMGQEKGGIDEIWIHPFMALRDYELGIQFSYKDTIYWLNDERPSFEVSPAYVKRVYNFRRAFLTEIISADPENPAGVIHYEYRGVYPAKLYIKVKSNLRLMWPYSENAAREIRCNYRSNNIVFESPQIKLSSIIGVNKKAFSVQAGHFNNFIKKDSIFTGIESDKMQVSGLFIFDLEMNDNIDVTISGSSVNKSETVDYYKKISAVPYEVYSRSVDYVNDFLDKNISITTPDENINTGIKWALIGTDKFFVNTPGIGKSLVAGYSTTARGWNGGHKINGRPGYSWYFGRDAQWSGLAIIDYGDFAKVKEIISVFNKFQDVRGKIYHELTTSGAVHYDAADATPLYIILCGKYLRHSGDINFVKENWSYIKKAIDYCYSTDTDGDNLIENTNVGHGWVEGGNLYGAHTTLYLASCWAEALKEAGFLASALGLNNEADKYFHDYKNIHNIINKDFWNRKDNFFYYGKFRDGTYNPEKTVLPAIPALFGIADREKALHLLDDYASDNFTSDWGVRILSSKSPLFNPSGYHYGSVWPLFTGWTSLAEYKYGNYLQGFSHMMNNLNVYRSFSKGYVEEVLNGAVYKPSGVCPHQCWSETMVLQPIIEGMLGLEINVMKNEVHLSPRFPADWQNASVKNIKAGNRSLSFSMKKGREIIFNFKADPGINILFNPAVPLLSEIREVSLNGKPINYELVTEQQNLVLKTNFITSGNDEIVIKLVEGVAVLSFICNPLEGDSSTGLRIIGTEIINKRLFLTLEGKSYSESELRIYSPNKRIVGTGELKITYDKGIYTAKIPFTGIDRYIRKKINLVIE